MIRGRSSGEGLGAAGSDSRGGVCSVSYTHLDVYKRQWLEGLATYDVIYLGEEHHNRSHIDAALTVLRSLMSQGRRPWLAMEMFGWDGQPALARYLRSEESIRSEFLEQVAWKQNWGGAFEDYEP